MGLYICIYIHACGPPPVPHMAVRTVASLTHHWPPPTPTTSGSCSGPTRSAPPPPGSPWWLRWRRNCGRTIPSLPSPSFPPSSPGNPLSGGGGLVREGGRGCLSIAVCLSAFLHVKSRSFAAARSEYSSRRSGAACCSVFNVLYANTHTYSFREDRILLQSPPPPPPAMDN